LLVACEVAGEPDAYQQAIIQGLVKVWSAFTPSQPSICLSSR
jgi:hypothetical protein